MDEEFGVYATAYCDYLDSVNGYKLESVIIINIDTININKALGDIENKQEYIDKIIVLYLENKLNKTTTINDLNSMFKHKIDTSVLDFLHSLDYIMSNYNMSNVIHNADEIGIKSINSNKTKCVLRINIYRGEHNHE